MPPVNPRQLPESAGSPVPGPPRRGHLSTGAVAFISAIVGAVAVVGLLSLLGLFSTDATDLGAPPETVAKTTTTVAQQVISEITTNGGDIGIAEAIAVKVIPSVVTVEVGNLNEGVLTLTGSGSGVILGDEYVVTNHHVVEDATVTRVVLQDGRTYDADIVGSDAYTDLAVLRVDAADLTPIDLGSTDRMVIGQFAVAVGNPLGQEGGVSLTAGVISALSRTVEFGDQSALYGMIQTDAPITSGSSGGALVDAEGHLVGITSAIGVSRAGAEGIGYAIPVELVRRITDEIIADGAVRHSFLGIYGDDHVEAADDGALAPAGAEIIELWDGEEGSAAGDAGFVAGDVIVSVQGIDIANMQDLVVILRLYHVGDEIEISVMRAGEPITAVVVLDERPDDPPPLVDEETPDDE